MTIERIIKSRINLRIPVRGFSMFPVLSTGDSVIVSSVDNLKKGDIILFRKDENIVCHRVMKIISREGKVFYVTRGDSLFYDDAPVSVDDIIGKVSIIERKRMSLPRRLLLMINPLLRPRIINAILIDILVRIRHLTRSGLPA